MLAGRDGDVRVFRREGVQSGRSEDSVGNWVQLLLGSVSSTGGWASGWEGGGVALSYLGDKRSAAVAVLNSDRGQDVMFKPVEEEHESLYL